MKYGIPGLCDTIGTGKVLGTAVMLGAAATVFINIAAHKKLGLPPPGPAAHTISAAAGLAFGWLGWAVGHFAHECEAGRSLHRLRMRQIVPWRATANVFAAQLAAFAVATGTLSVMGSSAIVLGKLGAQRITEIAAAPPSQCGFLQSCPR